jgi:hypothetical protein
MSDASNNKSDIMHAKGCHSNLKVELLVALDEVLKRDQIGNRNMIDSAIALHEYLPALKIWRVVMWYKPQGDILVRISIS